MTLAFQVTNANDRIMANGGVPLTRRFKLRFESNNTPDSGGYLDRMCAASTSAWALVPSPRLELPASSQGGTLHSIWVPEVPLVEDMLGGLP